jgi:hypothetical protein
MSVSPFLLGFSGTKKPALSRERAGWESDESCSRFAWFRVVYVLDLAKPPSVSRGGAPDIEHMHIQIRTAATGVAVKWADVKRFVMFRRLA